jgi:farnesyl diphosphate synthase
MSFEAFVTTSQARVIQVLDKLLPNREHEPHKLHQAMRYAVFSGGKRIRPLLVYAVGQTFHAKRGH